MRLSHSSPVEQLRKRITRSSMAHSTRFPGADAPYAVGPDGVTDPIGRIPEQSSSRRSRQCSSVAPSSRNLAAWTSCSNRIWKMWNSDFGVRPDDTPGFMNLELSPPILAARRWPVELYNRKEYREKSS